MLTAGTCLIDEQVMRLQRNAFQVDITECSSATILTSEFPSRFDGLSSLQNTKLKTKQTSKPSFISSRLPLKRIVSQSVQLTVGGIV